MIFQHNTPLILVIVVMLLSTIIDAQTTTTPLFSTTTAPATGSSSSSVKTRALVYTYDESSQCRGRIANSSVFTLGASSATCSKHWFDSALFVKAKKCDGVDTLFSVHLTSSCEATSTQADISVSAYSCVPHSSNSSFQVFCINSSAGSFSRLAVVVLLLLVSMIAFL